MKFTALSLALTCSFSYADRTDDLVAQLTLEEKIKVRPKPGNALSGKNGKEWETMLQ